MNTKLSHDHVSENIDASTLYELFHHIHETLKPIAKFSGEVTITPPNHGSAFILKLKYKRDNVVHISYHFGEYENHEA